MFPFERTLVTSVYMTQGVAANFAPHFAPSPAFVAQWIEQRFPKPQVAGPIPAEGARCLSDSYCTGVPPCGAIWGNAGDNFSLGVATFVGGANLNRVFA